MNDSAFDANRKAIFETSTEKHGFVFSTNDSQLDQARVSSFFEAGPDINYGYRFGGATRSVRCTRPTRRSRR